MNKEMNRELRWMQCLFCGRDINLPVKVERSSSESLLVFSGECGCNSCKVGLFFPDIKMIFRETNSDGVKVGKGRSFFLMGCPDESCAGKVKIYLSGAVEVRTSFATLKEANEKRHLRNKGNFRADISRLTSSCSDCAKHWEVELENQILSFETMWQQKHG